MIARPHPGQIVGIWYNQTARRWMALHGQRATVICQGPGPGPRNVGLELDDGRRAVVPCGNLQRWEWVVKKTGPGGLGSAGD